MKLFDAHTHLNAEPLIADWKSYLQKFIEAGGAGLVNSWASESYNIQGIEIAKSVTSQPSSEEGFSKVIVKTTLGRHPGECWMEENIEEKMNELRTLYKANKEYIAAIGECGIDLHYPWSLERLNLQKKLFAMQCELARELDLPLVVHSRDAFVQTMDVLRAYSDSTIYFHCWGYWPNEVQKLKVESTKLNWKLYIGFCGNITYKKADALRESLKLVPLESLLLETDAPWLTPQAIRWETNHPANVKYIYEEIGRLYGDWGIEVDLEAIVEKNFKSLYNL